MVLQKWMRIFWEIFETVFLTRKYLIDTRLTWYGLVHTGPIFEFFENWHNTPSEALVWTTHPVRYFLILTPVLKISWNIVFHFWRAFLFEVSLLGNFLWNFMEISWKYSKLGNFSKDGPSKMVENISKLCS